MKLKIIFINPNINIQKIVERLKINIEEIEDIINEFLDINLIKRTENDNNINEIKFIINKMFSYKQNYFSILKKQKNNNQEIENNNLFEKNKVIYSCLINLLKKSEKLEFSEIYTELSKRLPFKISVKELNDEINKGKEINDILEELNEKYKTYSFIV